MEKDLGADDTVERFVADLRALREQHPGRSFQALSNRAQVSKSVLHDAVTRSDRLPSRRTVQRLVGVLEPADVATWAARRDRLASRHRDESESATAGPCDPVPPSTSAGLDQRRGPSWMLVGMLLILVALISAGVTAVVMRTERTPPTPQSEERAPTVSWEGRDPIDTPCLDDVSVAAARTIPDRGTLKLLYSARCRSYWAKVTRSDGLSRGYQIRISVVDADQPSRTQQAVEPNVSAAYTVMLVRADQTDRACARASMTNASGTFSFGELLC